MHELMLAESVIGIIEAAAKQAPGRRVVRVRLALGQLAHVEPEALLYCCELVGRDSVAAQAEYLVERTPGQAWCMPCAQTVALPGPIEPCPLCGAYQLTITGGQDMRVIDIELE